MGVSITFAQDGQVLVWLLAEKRPRKGHSLLSQDRAIVCYGEHPLDRDHIRSKFLDGAFRYQDFKEENTFLTDIVSAETPKRSFSDGHLRSTLQGSSFV